MHRRFSVASATATPWKNGGGTTVELACWPPGAALTAFHWRVSIATVAASGAFSLFPGIDRTIMLLSGSGMHLRSQEGSVDHRLAAPCVPFAFSGDLSIHCELLAGLSRDFNVMTRRPLRAGVRLARAPIGLPTSPHGLLYANTGQWSLNAGTDTHTIDPGEGIWWADDAARVAAEPLSTGATLIVVQFDWCR